MPITGVEAYFRPNRLIAKKFKQRNAWHLCLFAKNLKGWHSLLQIVSTAFQDPMTAAASTSTRAWTSSCCGAIARVWSALLPASPPTSLS
jgi:DNA polymerase III alpha subunit